MQQEEGTEPLVVPVPQASTETAPLTKPLSKRESEVLQFVAAGLSNGEISRRLGTTDKTVKAQVTSIMQKLGVPSRTGAAVIALQRGLVNPIDEFSLTNMP